MITRSILTVLSALSLASSTWLPGLPVGNVPTASTILPSLAPSGATVVTGLVGTETVQETFIPTVYSQYISLSSTLTIAPSISGTSVPPVVVGTGGVAWAPWNQGSEDLAPPSVLPGVPAQAISSNTIPSSSGSSESSILAGPGNSVPTSTSVPSTTSNAAPLPIVTTSYDPGAVTQTSIDATITANTAIKTSDSSHPIGLYPFIKGGPSCFFCPPGIDKGGFFLFGMNKPGIFPPPPSPPFPGVKNFPTITIGNDLKPTPDTEENDQSSGASTSSPATSTLATSSAPSPTSSSCSQALTASDCSVVCSTASGVSSGSGCSTSCYSTITGCSVVGSTITSTASGGACSGIPAWSNVVTGSDYRSQLVSGSATSTAISSISSTPPPSSSSSAPPASLPPAPLDFLDPTLAAILPLLSTAPPPPPSSSTPPPPPPSSSTPPPPPPSSSAPPPSPPSSSALPLPLLLPGVVGGPNVAAILPLLSTASAPPPPVQTIQCTKEDESTDDIGAIGPGGGLAIPSCSCGGPQNPTGIPPGGACCDNDCNCKASCVHSSKLRNRADMANGNRLSGIMGKESRRRFVERAPHSTTHKLTNIQPKLESRAGGNDPTWLKYAGKGQQYYTAWSQKNGPDNVLACNFETFFKSGDPKLTTPEDGWLLKTYGIEAGQTYYSNTAIKDGDTNGIFKNTMSPKEGVFLAEDNFRGTVTTGDTTTPAVPYHFSDIAWWQWKRSVEADNAGRDPSTLDFSGMKYFFRTTIVNADTQNIMDQAFKLNDVDGSQPLSFTPANPQDPKNAFMALLGTPNGNGAIHLLTDYKQAMHQKSIVSMNIQKIYGETYYMWAILSP